jgi:hypothetical protein
MCVSVYHINVCTELTDSKRKVKENIGGTLYKWIVLIRFQSSTNMRAVQCFEVGGTQMSPKRRAMKFRVRTSPKNIKF